VRLFVVVIGWSIVVVGLQLLHVDPRSALHVPAGDCLQDDLEGRGLEHLVQSGVRAERAVRNFEGRAVWRDAVHGYRLGIRWVRARRTDWSIGLPRKR